MKGRAQWGTRAGFILAAAGSAIGIGNLWRFPAVAYENGGGAFFVPYLFALLTAGIPILILEFTIGHKFRGSSPLSFTRISKGSEWIGWWQVAIAFVISTYYALIVAWAMSFMVFSFSGWGADTSDFFLNEYLHLTDPGKIGDLVPGVFVPLIITWIIVLGVLMAGVKKGIERANKILLPLLIGIFLIIVIRSVTLDGALMGLNEFFQPDWSQILNGNVWIAAYGQIFFSLSIGFAIMITYSSYLSRRSDLTNNAFIIGFGNSSFELLAGIGVFSALGFMATQLEIPVDEVADGGIMLAFVVFPEIINQFPGFNGIFGFLFFGSLMLAGLTSLISVVEAYVAAVQEKFGFSRKTTVLFAGGLSAVVSLIYATQGGLNILDVVDYFINQFGVVLAALIEIVFIAWFAKQLKPLQSHADSISQIKLGAWWRICLLIITPIVLGYMMFDSIRQNLLGEYEEYPRSFIFNYGWSLIIVVLLIAVLITLKKWNKKTTELPASEKEEEVS